MGRGQPGKPVRKRNRKRKRRAASDSSSSEDSSSSSSSSSSDPSTRKIPSPVGQPTDEDESGDDVSSSSDESQDDSDSVEENVDMSGPSTGKPAHSDPPLQRHSSSPPPNVDIPPFISPDAPKGEQALKEKFRKFWMASVAEGFKDDLEEIRKEPNLGPSRLALLIESLASGADVFTSNSTTTGGVNEMEVVLDQLS